MKKSLNDSLREEFSGILEKPEYQELVKNKKLDQAIVAGAFEKLLSGDRFLNADVDDIDKNRSEFENYILNTLKTRQH
jgi:hypothetical protein